MIKPNLGCVWEEGEQMVFAYGEAENGSSEDVTSMTLGGKKSYWTDNRFCLEFDLFFL